LNRSNMSLPRPTIGIALSGAAGRAGAHIGVLDVLREHNIPIDYIVGCSSGAIVAAGFCTGTMQQLLKDPNANTLRGLLKLFSRKNIRGGLFHLREADFAFNRYTKGLNFEDVKPKIGFTATDLDTAEMVLLSKGSMNDALRATACVPGWFEPVIIKNRVLVDGGLADIVPVRAVKEMGADIIIGVDIASARHLYSRRISFRLWKLFRMFTNSSPEKFQALNKNKLTFFRVLARAWDLGIKILKNEKSTDLDCDLMLEPSVKHYPRLAFKSLDKIYREGRKSAEANIGRIKSLIAGFENKKERAKIKGMYETVRR
jgi:NTE family protein